MLTEMRNTCNVVIF